jgi:DNA-damage-inducible protein D
VIAYLLAPDQAGHMSTSITAFGPTPEASEFEALGCENGHRYWWQSDLRRLLGYASSDGLDKAVGRAMAACTALGISVPENFEHCRRTREDGSSFPDVKLSRFACYLIAMNANPRKEEVAQAQAYFAGLAEIARQYIEKVEHVDRVLMRDEMADREMSLARTARAGGVDDYALFQNAGYRGLYNLNLNALKKRKGIPAGRTLLDFMGKEELAANLFRITQTESKIKKEEVRGQRNLEATAHSVGQQVRSTIRKIGGTMPEHLPASEDIKKVKSGMKKAHREIQKVDKPKRVKKPTTDSADDS